MIDLDMAYNEGLVISPPPGRYTVSVKIHSMWQVILEKTISVTEQGHNHPPMFFMRYFNLPFMDFKISTDIVRKEIVFTYENGWLVDRLKKKKDKNKWIGKVFGDGKFLGYFILRPK